MDTLIKEEFGTNHTNHTNSNYLFCKEIVRVVALAYGQV
jgi:hypothetical protein